MKDKRKKTSFRDFLKEVTSWVPLTMFFNRDGYISRFPNSTRIKKVIHKDDYEVKRDNFTNEGKEYTDKIPFQDQVQELFQSIDFPNTISFGKNDNTDFADIIVG